jgi:hypothetical protein
MQVVACVGDHALVYRGRGWWLLFALVLAAGVLTVGVVSRHLSAGGIGAGLLALAWLARPAYGLRVT